MRLVHLAATAWLATAAPAAAQWWLGGGTDTAGSDPCTRDNTWTVEPEQTDSFTFKFEGRTLAVSPTPIVTARLAKTVQADGSPSQIVTGGPAVSGSTVSVQLNPDNGCGTAGCRAGNWYQLDVQPTDDASNKPTLSACVYVRPVTLAPQ